MTDKNFLVSGTAISSSVQGLLKLPKRKFYNAVYFNDNQYRHEIANNYRDFKLKRRIRQRKKRVNIYCCGKVEATKYLSLDYQQELPMAVHMFPSFEKIYTPRRHQKFCEQRRPVFIYNDTIKRIQNANDNTELLKKLAKKQLESLKHHNLYKTCLNDIEKTYFHKANKLQICKFQQSRLLSLEKLETIDYLKRQQPFEKDCGVTRAFPIETQHLQLDKSDTCSGRIGDETIKYYLQLASNFYQQGFIKNIKYLENLGERNQLRHKRHIKPQLQQQQQKLKFHTFGDLSSTTTISLETEHITDTSFKSCERKQNQINPNNPIVWHKNKLEVNEFPPNNSKTKSCAIRVNIKPQTFNTNQNHQANFLLKEIYGKKKIKQESKDINSMNDFFNGNLEYTQLLQQEQQQHLSTQKKIFYNHTSVNNHNFTEKVLLLDNLIDNFKELDIQQENRTNLPRITLTDYTQKYPNELETTLQTPAITQESKKRLDSYLIRQSSLDCSQLDIPLETHYHSEARPP